MIVFVTGASGYLGGSVAAALQEAGHTIRGLARSEDSAARLAERGVMPVRGSLDDAALLAHEARAADAVVNAASSDHRGAAEALIDGLAGSGKPLLHTSGTSIVADDAAGATASDRVHDEQTPFEPLPQKAARVAIDRLVRNAAGRGVRSVVLCNSMVYGIGRGLHPDSVQVPMMAAQARRSGVVRHVGAGANIWSNVHVDDVAALYGLALERAPAGAFYFVENGEASYRQIAEALARRLRLGQPQPWSLAEAAAAWGEVAARTSFGSNSRVRGRRARSELGWQPQGPALLDWIAAAA